MPIETFDYLDSLNPNNPPTADGLVGGDDHIRGIKASLKSTFPNVAGAVTASHTTMNALAAFLVNGVLRGNGACPAGALMDFGGTTAPTGWLACDGQAISRTTYADLYAAIGTTWGAGDGSTTFNVPSLANRFRRHRADASLAGPVGTLKGPANLGHTHTGSGTTSLVSNDHTHSFSGTTGVDSPDHSHNVAMFRNNGIGGAGTVVYNALALNSVGGSSAQGVQSDGASARHAHSFSGTTSGISANHSHTYNFVTSSGSTDDANEARPYSATVLTCIKT